MHSKTKLDLGSGEKPIEDCVNVDMTARTHPDVVLNRTGFVGGLFP